MTHTLNEEILHLIYSLSSLLQIDTPYLCHIDLKISGLTAVTYCRLELQPVVTKIPKCEKTETGSKQEIIVVWPAGYFGFNGHLKQYFGPSPRERERETGRKKREMIDEIKVSKQPPPTPTSSTVGHCFTIIQIKRTARH